MFSLGVVSVKDRPELIDQWFVTGDRRIAFEHDAVFRLGVGKNIDPLSTLALTIGTADRRIDRFPQLNVSHLFHQRLELALDVGIVMMRVRRGGQIR